MKLLALMLICLLQSVAQWPTSALATSTGSPDDVAGSETSLEGMEVKARLDGDVLCAGEFNLTYKSGVNGGWTLDMDKEAVIPAPKNGLEEEEVRTTLELFATCTQVQGRLVIDGRKGTGDGEPSEIPLGAEVSVPQLPNLRRARSVLLTGAFHDLRGLGRLAYVDRDLMIHKTNELGSLKENALENLTTVGGDVVIDGNHVLTSIHGLNGLRRVGGVIRIEKNPKLKSVSGFKGVVTAGGVEIMDNRSLNQISGLSGIRKVRNKSLADIQEFVKPGHLDCIV